MARAHIEKEIVTNISGIIKKQSDELNMETGITSSLDDSEIARYIDEVISEFHKPRTNTKDH